MAVTLRDVTRAYPATNRSVALEAVREVSLHADPGEVLGIVGPSGCGKTTLLELICGLQVPDTGTLTAQPAALMAQNDLLLPWLSALDNACLALRVGRGRIPAGTERATTQLTRPLARAHARAVARPWFSRFGLSGFEDARPYELSGGMRQRVAFLRTLLSGKPVLCLDEPFGALDALTRAEMQRWLELVLEEEKAEGDVRTVMLVTHDVEEAVLLCDHVLVMSPRPGRVVTVTDVSLPRPRLATDPRVAALRAETLDALRAAGVST